MKRLFILSFILAFTSTLMAQITGDGYYRVKNYSTGRYICVYDNTGSINIATTSADMGAIELHKDVTKLISDPGSIIYVKSVGAKYDFLSQGTGVHQIIGYYVELIQNSSDKTYYVYAEGKYLDDNETSSRELGYLGTDRKGDYRKWMALPLNDTDNYFGVAPTIELNGKYYRPFYAAFPFTLSEGMKAYYIKKVTAHAAILSKITGTVPSSTPCLIECISANTADNKLNLQMSDATAISANQLKGVYFNNPDRQKSKDARTAYNANTMRVLTVKDGKLVYATDSSLDYLPANESYLVVPEGTDADLAIMTEEEYEAASKATSITLSQTELSLQETSTATLTATVLPTTAENQSVTWASSDETIATVNAEGVVTAIKAGTATITATTNDGTNLSASCNVTVTIIPVSSIKLSADNLSLLVGDVSDLTATVAPENASCKDIIWSSDDASIATVENGIVTAVAPGRCFIKVTTTDGSNLSAICMVVVNPILVSSIKLNSNNLSLKIGDEAELSATIAPENATCKDVVWTSDDTNVATVENGKVTAIGVGNTTIKVTTADGSNLSASCLVTVDYAEGVEKITLTDAKGNIYDLYGRKVTSPKKGIYVINNKKVVIK